MNESISTGRAKKAREFRDRESAGSQSLWTLIASLQAIFVGFFSISFSSKETTTCPYLFLVVFFLGTTTMIILVYLATKSRNIDSRIAAYFDLMKLPKSDRPVDFCDKEVNKNNEKELTCFLKKRDFFEKIAFACLLINTAIYVGTTIFKIN